MKGKWRRFSALMAAVLVLTGMQTVAAFATASGRILSVSIKREAGHDSTLRLGAGDSLGLTVVTTGGTPDQWEWTSSNTSVATVSGADDSATVTPVGKGGATITVKVSSGSYSRSASIGIRVIQMANSIKVTDASGATVAPGDTITVYRGKSVILKGSADADASIKTLTWASDNPAVATVSGGRITGKSAGTAEITASTKDREDPADNLNQTITVEVKEPASSIKLEKDGATLKNNQVLTYEYDGADISPEDNFTLEAAAMMADSSEADEQSLTWRTSNQKVAKVTADTDGKTATVELGQVKGTSTISARDAVSGKQISIRVQIRSIPTSLTVYADGVELDPVDDSYHVGAGKTIALRTSVLPADANSKRVTWTSSDPSIASVSTTGRVTGLQYSDDPGTITATTGEGGKTATVDVKVDPVASSIQIFDDDGQDVSGKSTEIVRAASASQAVALTGKITKSDGSIDNSKIKWTISGTKTAEFAGGLKTVEGGNVVVNIIGSGKATITAAATDGSGKRTNYRISVLQPATDIRPNKGIDTYEIGEGKSLILKAIVGPSNASRKTVSWSTSDTSIVSVSQKTGQVKALQPGTATVTATADGGNGVSCDFTVEVKAVVQSVQIYEGSDLVNNAVIPLDVNSGDITVSTVSVPADAVSEMKWTSSNTKAVRIEPSSDGRSAKLTPIGKGRSQIYARATDGSGKYAKVTIQVDIPVDALDIVPSDTSIAVGRGVTLKTQFTPANASNRTVDWTSQDVSIAKVSSSGRVVGVNAGETKIFAQVRGGTVIAECNVRVVPAVTKVTLSKGGTDVPKTLDVSLAEGSVDFSAAIDPSDASQEVVWSSNSPKTASVDDNGHVTLHGIGRATIKAKATDGTGKSAYVIVNVTR